VRGTSQPVTPLQSYRYVPIHPRLQGGDESARNEISFLIAGMPRAVHGKHHFSSITASVGQTSLQVPHSVHFSWLIMYLSDPSSIASEGHSSLHVPQETQSSVILNAMFLSPPYVKYNRVKFKTPGFLFPLSELTHRIFLYNRQLYPVPLSAS
jgi:hypothetical protein